MVRAAAQRDDRCVTLSPTLKDGAAQKIAAKLIAAKLVREIKAKAGTPVWRRDGEGGQPLALKLTAAGLKAIAVNKETAAPEAIVESTSSVDAAAGFQHSDDAAPREGSKLAAVAMIMVLGIHFTRASERRARVARRAQGLAHDAHHANTWPQTSIVIVMDGRARDACHSTYRRPMSNRTTRTIRMMPSKPTPPWPNP